MPRITREEVHRIAELARLSLSEEEAELMSGQLAAVLDHVEELSSLDLAGVEPTAHAIPVRMELREDAPRPSLPVEAALANAPAHDESAFLVPKVIEGEEG